MMIKEVLSLTDLLPKDILQIFEAVAQSSNTIGQESFVIGGFVRDFYLTSQTDFKRTDIDFVTLGSGIVLAEEVAKHLNATNLSVFKRFGTAHIAWNGYDIEFVGARKESYSPDSRKPVVEDGSLEENVEILQ